MAKFFTCTCCGKQCFDHRLGVCFPCGMAGARVNVVKSCDYCKPGDGPPVCPEHGLVDCQLMSGRAEHLRFWEKHGPRLRKFQDREEEP